MINILFLIAILNMTSCQFLSSPIGMAIQQEIAEEVVEYIIEELEEEENYESNP